MNWQDRIIADPGVLVGQPVIKGTRISVSLVLDLLARNWTRSQIIQQYDHITDEDIQACLEYAKDLIDSERVYPLPA